MKKRSIAKVLLVLLLFGIALVLMVYPYVANYLFEHQTESVVNAVEQAVQTADDEELLAEIEAARQYNEIIASGHVQLTDPFMEEQLDDDFGKYDSLLCMMDDGVMGFIEIPSIDVSLPVYHGTSEQVLEKGAGHLQGTSLPVGGESTHTVLTGHTGLSSAKLFTDLTELDEGDVFFLTVMGQKLAYEVDQIKIVLPSELDALSVVSGKDYCTLVTCTPYGVNSHRLLVRGVRTDYQEAVDNPETFQKKTVESKWMSEYKRALFISIACFAVCLVVLIMVRCLKRTGAAN